MHKVVAVTSTQLYSELLGLGVVISVKTGENDPEIGRAFSSAIHGRDFPNPPPTPDVEAWPSAGNPGVFNVRPLTDSGLDKVQSVTGG